MEPITLVVKNFTYPNGKLAYREYFLNGNLHNPFGPAIQYFALDGKPFKEMYYINGNRHNAGGAAIIEYDNSCVIFEEFWLNNKIISKINFLKTLIK